MRQAAYPYDRFARGRELPASEVASAGSVAAEAAARAAADTTLQANINLKANIASPTFTGDPRAPTPTPGDSDTSIATTAFVTSAVSAGAGINQLTGDGTAGPGTGSQALTLAAVNSNVGTFQGITVNAKGLVTAAANQTYLTANQSITLSGDLSGSGTTAINAQISANAVGTAEIANSNVTYAKIQNVTNNRILGNTSGSAAAPAEIALPLPVALGGTGDDGTAWAAYTPTITATSGTITTVAATGRFKQIGKLVVLAVRATITTNGTGAGGVVATLPVSPSAVQQQIIAGRENQNTGKMLQGVTAGSSLQIYNYDNTYPGGNGNVLVITGIYEAA